MDDNDIKKHWPSKVIETNGKPSITVKHKGLDRDFTPEEISTMLSKMKEIAEAYLGEKVTTSLLSPLLEFNDAQCQATKDAGTIAGLSVLRIINEPTAAAITYGLNKKANPISSFRNRIMDHLIKGYKKTGADVTKNLRALGKLKREVEKTKRTLSSQQRLKASRTEAASRKTLTHAKFEEINMDANVKEDVDEVVLVSGSTHIPKIQQLLKDYWSSTLLLSVSRLPVVSSRS
ncbi:heat-shock cognate 70 [Amanita rubescens]|nr:heat-shock cognate 70 [Amanita rubescens]